MSKSVIVFEDADMLEEWDNIHPTLRKVFATLIQVWPEGVPVRLTSLNRTWEEDRALKASGVHSAGPPWRAVDIGGAGIDQAHLNAMGDFVNTVWTYDKNRPKKNLKCAVTKLHGTGKHIHLQVHKRTRSNVE
jgi:hypothetical protein